MYRGKQTCKILKDIRREIAKANDIEYVTSECRYKGDCAGTCPKCEAEVRYLEEQLRNRQLSGKKVALAGLVAGAFLAPINSQAQNNNAVVPVPDSCQVQQPLQGVPAMPVPETVPVPNPPVEGLVEMDEKTYNAIVETCPVYTGGDAELMKDLMKVLVYPKRAAKAKLEGQVVLKFSVKEDGTVGKIKVVKSTNKIFTRAAIKALRSLPKKFKPVLFNGKNVSSELTIPITFRLNK